MLSKVFAVVGRWSDVAGVAKGAQKVAKSCVELASEPGYLKAEVANWVQRAAILRGIPIRGGKRPGDRGEGRSNEGGSRHDAGSRPQGIGSESSFAATTLEHQSFSDQSKDVKDQFYDDIASGNVPTTNEDPTISVDIPVAQTPSTVTSGDQEQQQPLPRQRENSNEVNILEVAPNSTRHCPPNEEPEKPDIGPSVQQPLKTHDAGPILDREPGKFEDANIEETDQTIRMQSAREFRVPESAFSRAIGFGRLGAGLLFGAVSETAKRSLGTGQLERPTSVLMSDANAERIASSLSRMRGAALKVGQMLSIQDEKLIPPALMKSLDRVRQSADYMPKRQLEKMMIAELGVGWRSKFKEFEDVPMAAASIGQVHKAVLQDGRTVAVKVQYPGVANSIDSDLNNLKRLVTYSGMIPKTLYIDETMKFAREELSRECDYLQEADHQRKFVSFVGKDDPDFAVPEVIDELSTKAILTTEFAPGQSIDLFSAASQTVRNRIGRLFLKLTLRELFQFRYMQTDPNFSNFLYDSKADKLRMLDFGAATGYPSKFVENYLRMVNACAEKDRDKIIFYGQELGFLVGEESKLMLDAHTAASSVVGEPFGTLEPYDFKASNISGRMAKHGKDLLEHRLCPPPVEAYSLHRRLSGAFLMCMRLNATFTCRDLFLEVYDDYKFEHT